jgi:polysaccharide biosynthesis protein PelA
MVSVMSRAVARAWGCFQRLVGHCVPVLLCLGAPFAQALPVTPATPPDVAFWYGPSPPWEQLQAFDVVVVDPDHVRVAPQADAPHTTLAAYVAVGEVQPSRAYAARMNPAWFKGENKDWGSRLIDQSAPEWPEFFAREVIGPLWQAGYRAFFLDTLDSYHRLATTDAARAQQEAGLVRVIETLRLSYPEARLIYNRGFEILERTHRHVWMMAAESLYQGYDAGKKLYRPVPEADREWLLGQLNTAHKTYGLPVISIDYVAPGQHELARTTVQQITALGFTPWVTTPDLASMGLGRIEALPRRVLVVHNPLEDEYALSESPVVRFLTMPLNYLGYRVDYADTAHLPIDAPDSVIGRYAGVVLWLSDSPGAAEQSRLVAWLARMSEMQVPVVLLNDVGLLSNPTLARRWGLRPGVEVRSGPISVHSHSPWIGFERTPRASLDAFIGREITQGTPLLTLRRGATEQVAAALTPWGGFVQAPFAVSTLSTGKDARWVIDPIAFLSAALQVPAQPMPDVTTESGRRLLLVHMDGDGFPSKAEFDDRPFASEVIRDRVVRRRKVPMTISIIEAELSPDGKARDMSFGPLRPLEKIASDIFKEPHVEIATHSFSHPFNWQNLAQGSTAEGNSLVVPGYRFDVAREVDGSVGFIEKRLAPPGKKVAMFLWTGDCNPGTDVIERTQRLGLLNMNGGDTIITHSLPTLTSVAPLGIERGAQFQVFAPNQNENVYTNNWTGPFNGFERVIETFEMTESPRRLKPINIYFHTYIGSKRASLASLDKIFDYAEQQETHPIFSSDYARKVLNFRTLSIARTPDGWRIRGAQALRTVRLPKLAGVPDLATSKNIAGYRKEGDVTYVHLAGDDAELRISKQTKETPNLVSSNARITSFTQTGKQWRWQLQAHVPLEFSLSGVTSCEVRVDGKRLDPVRRTDAKSGDKTGAIHHYRLTQHAARPLEAICRG